MKETDLELARDLMFVDSVIWDAHGYFSRPSGEERETYLVECSRALMGRFDLEGISEDVLEVLETENRHSLLDALDVALGRTTVDALMERERELERASR